MGITLPKPILSKVVERAGNTFASASCSSLNGFRTSMEDAHMMITSDPDIAYFGIFDGHSSDGCSHFIAEKLPAKLQALKEPISAADLERVCIELDAEFFTMDSDGGSTGTFCILRRDGRLTVANVGDSRILVSREGSQLFETVDHKPKDPAESERVRRCGGTILNNRVDGDLAVTRAFGDQKFKVRGTKDPRNQKIIAIPDVTELQCQPGDVIIIACDGVFEGNFPSSEVIKYVSNQMNTCWGDTAVVACRVCDEAIRRGSKDNISCMVVQVAEGASKVQSFGAFSFVPGPPFPRNHAACRTAYRKMAELARRSTADALRERYALLQAYDRNELDLQPPVMRTAYDMSDEVDVETERAFFGRGPAPGNEAAFFEALAQGNTN